MVDTFQAAKKQRMKIQRYSIQPDRTRAEITAPVGTWPTHVAFQEATAGVHAVEMLCVWCFVPAEQTEMQELVFRVFGTGEEFDSTNLMCVGSVVTRALEWHVFMELPSTR